MPDALMRLHERSALDGGPEQCYTLAGGAVLDVDNGSWMDANVVVEGARIVAVGPSVEAGPILDVTGRWLMPGMIDAHAHVMVADGFPDHTPNRMLLAAQRSLIAHLGSGVTTVRDLGAPTRLSLDVRDAVRAGDVVGPDMVCAGTFISITGGHMSHMGMEADGPVDVVKAVRHQLKEGADFIKVMASAGVGHPDETLMRAEYTLPELESAVEEATRAGTYVAAHAHSDVAVAAAVAAGARTVEHGTFLTDDIVKESALRGAWVIPTFAVYECMASLSRLPRRQRESARAVADHKLAAFTGALRQGVLWGVGTDSGGYLDHGSIVAELEAMRRAGLSDLDLLLGVTAGNARALGLGDVGAIKAGMRANLLVLGRDPSTDVAALRQLEAVVKAGKCWDPKELRCLVTR